MLRLPSANRPEFPLPSLQVPILQVDSVYLTLNKGFSINPTSFILCSILSKIRGVGNGCPSLPRPRKFSRLKFRGFLASCKQNKSYNPSFYDKIGHLMKLGRWWTVHFTWIHLERTILNGHIYFGNFNLPFWAAGKNAWTMPKRSTAENVRYFWYHDSVARWLFFIHIFAYSTTITI